MKAPKLISITVLLFIQAATTTAFAQDKPKAGDTISGIVCDQEGPMMQVYVTERDSTNHVVTYCSTTMDGKFSFVLVNPKDSIKASYVGYVPVIVPIDRTYIKIKMKEQPGSPIDITGHGRIKPLELKPGTIISGIVSDASTGEPIGNALIIETVENDTAAYYYTSTDRDGRFSYPLFGTGHVLKVIANQRVYKIVKIPLENMTTYEIKLEKDPDGDGGDGVMYSIGPFDIREGWEKSRSGSNISVVKPGSLRDDGEGIFIEEIE